MQLLRPKCKRSELRHVCCLRSHNWKWCVQMYVLKGRFDVLMAVLWNMIPYELRHVCHTIPSVGVCLSTKLNHSSMTFIKYIQQSCPCTGLYSPLGLQEVEAPRISTQSTHENGKVVRPKHRPPLPLRRYPWYSFLLQAESIPES